MTATTAARPYPLPTFAPQGPAGRWTAIDYTLAVALGVDDHATAGQIVADALPDQVARRVLIHPDPLCFMASTATRADLDAVCAVVALLVACGPHPDAIPGGADASPGFQRHGDLTVPHDWL